MLPRIRLRRGWPASARAISASEPGSGSAASSSTTLNVLFKVLRGLLGEAQLKPVYRPFRAGDVRHSGLAALSSR